MRRAEVRTELDHSDVVADAVRPDDTAQIATRVEDGAVVTTIERETTGGLRSTVDDYVVNLDVASRVAETPRPTSHAGVHESDARTREADARDHTTTNTRDDEPTTPDHETQP